MDSYLYRYGPLESGVLLKRYKRFLADIQLTSGEVITAHCPNTGPMTGVCIPGNPVMVSYSPSKTRKYPYTWELIQLNSEVDPPQPPLSNGGREEQQQHLELPISKGGKEEQQQHLEPPITKGEHLEPPISKGGLGGLIWTGVNTALPNKIINLALTEKLFPSLGNYSEIRKEVPYGMNLKSRVDFLLKGKDKPIYLEVKNTTWSDGKIALFPDTVTERGQKHLKELIEVVKQGDRAVMLYFINRGDCTEFAPGDTADPVYGQLLREAILVGVEILPCRFEITPEGIKYLGLALPLLR
ncbi:DNA/RNA nuclease SfsA [Planktothrix agardhii]|jgi:DNA-binding sugar fermentation-stimulating protein|nr:DNA/RNA nuclease SfsA [Planktothrix agardhii]MCB8759326.1 DNA/RNA nuclease SfsA [Planktothrix agardhii 1813]CAD5945054.1 Sugar fermentation stimulation protein homolog [Planktothrix agardhii]